MGTCFRRSSIRRSIRKSRLSTLIGALPDEVLERICLFVCRDSLPPWRSTQASSPSSCYPSSFPDDSDSPLWLTRNDFMAARPLLLLNKRFNRAFYNTVTRFSFFMINAYLDLNSQGLLQSLLHCQHLRELHLVIHDNSINFDTEHLRAFLAATPAAIQVVHLSWGTASHRSPAERSCIVDRALCEIANGIADKLRALSLDCCGTVSLTAAATVGILCPQLVRLALAYTYFEEWAVLKAFGRLEELHVRNVEQDPEMYRSIGANLPLLQSLSLTFYRPSLLPALQTLSTLQHLHTVHLTRFSPGIADLELEALSGFPTLARLRLRHMQARPEALIAFLRRTGARLQALWLDDHWLGCLPSDPATARRRPLSTPVSPAARVLAIAAGHCPNLDHARRHRPALATHWSQRPYAEALQCVVYRPPTPLHKPRLSHPRTAVASKLLNCFNKSVPRALGDV